MTEEKLVEHKPALETNPASPITRLQPQEHDHSLEKI